MKRLSVILAVMCLMFPLVSAGVGIGWDKESTLVGENSEVCLTYDVYNPWDEDIYAGMKISDNLKDMFSFESIEPLYVPKQTSSKEALPMEICFKVGEVFEKDCLVAGMLCKQTCSERFETFEGSIDAFEARKDAESGAIIGSKTAMSVSAPLTVRVKCIETPRNYTALYVLVALISGTLLAINFLRKRKSKKKVSKKKGSKKKAKN